MTKLERLERAILIFLVAAFVLGLTISVLRKSRSPVKVTIEKFDAGKYKEKGSELSSSYEKININTASAEDLEKIKGVGKTIAGRMIEYRYQKGSFATIDDIKSVKGVGTALFEKIKSKITVE